ncbi:hypothetical protein RF679_11415 [Undibacterium cyanobacteriorum]|uniref:Glycosyltransferase 2-like domain-containing protein n=1 Tax=Undibacterium cyanobacteriorum TaxID=3073561 RepID=A0ABY9RGL6_9BURK|nr:hypothetical protein [Undibacterium sp. 20NA77.5]WMW79256.1 hypothetical protein RF679_11415 [Undibacterium sp. 20NA77.5]
MKHIAIISHGHQDLLINSKLGGLLGAADCTIWVKDNRPSSELKSYCEQHRALGVHYSDAKPGLGFGENNNFLFAQVEREVGFQTGDIFIVMNPDITCDIATIDAFAEQMKSQGHQLATINLYRDTNYQVPDTNIRHFPGILSIIKMPIVNSFSETYDKQKFGSIESIAVEWASGAFLGFEPEHFRRLAGFDPAYFMYFEDVDICYRSRRDLQQQVYFYPKLKAVHLAQHKNRQLFSQHAKWFFQSFFTFLVRRYLRRAKVRSHHAS